MGRYKFHYINSYKVEDAGIMLNIIPKFQYRNNINFTEIQMHWFGHLLSFTKYKTIGRIFQFNSLVINGVLYRIGSDKIMNDIIYRVRFEDLNDSEIKLLSLLKDNTLSHEV